MTQTRPGAYVLYKEYGPGKPVWPAVVYADDLAPRVVQHGRPSGYVTLVLLLGEPLRFQWATTNQLSPLVPIEQYNVWPQSDEQRRAWGTASFLKDAGAGLEYWQEEVSKQFGGEAHPGLDCELEELFGNDEEIDEQLLEAIRISLKACAKSIILPTPSSSPPGKRREKTSRNVITIDSDDSDDSDDSLYSRPPRRGSRSSPKSPQPAKPPKPAKRVCPPQVRDGALLHLKNAQKKGQSIDCHRANRETQQKKPRSFRSGTTPLDQLSSLSQQASTPTSDAVEGDISKSKDFVQVLVGRDREIRTFQKKDVWNRPYFRDSRAGTNHFILNQDGMWELNYPQLDQVAIEDFQFAAEYLTDGDFGLRQPETHQMKEAIAQCVSAWETANQLNMDDMLEHIAEKVKFLEWDNEDVLTLAILVYRVQGPLLDAHNNMRDWISSYLAHHFWTYIKDEAIGHFFRKRLRLLPELERDVFVKRAANLTTGAELDEDMESDEDMMSNDTDL